MTVVRRLARPLLASMFVVGGLDSVRKPDPKSAAAEPVTERLVPLIKKVVPQLPDDPATLVRINGAAQLVAGLGLATGRLPRASALVLAASVVPTTAAGHRFWEESDPQARAGQRIHFLKNVSMLGGLLLAAVDTEGKPGVAWRAQHVGRDVKREAKRLRKDAVLQAKLAKAKAT